MYLIQYRRKYIFDLNQPFTEEGGLFFFKYLLNDTKPHGSVYAENFISNVDFTLTSQDSLGPRINYDDKIFVIFSINPCCAPSEYWIETTEYILLP